MPHVKNWKRKPMELGWSLKVSHHGETLYYIAHTHDMDLSHRIAEVAEETVDCSAEYAEAETKAGYQMWWPNCGYPNRYLVRNDRLREAIAADHRDLPPQSKDQHLPPERFTNFADKTIFDVELWDQS